MNAETEQPLAGAPVISSYSRAQALEDGVLVDLTAWAKETGFTIPVACTAAVWSDWIAPTAEMRAYGQEERGRAHDLLWMLYCAIRRAGKGDRIEFRVLFAQKPGKRPRSVALKSVCGPGDAAEPVLTIMLPNED